MRLDWLSSFSTSDVESAFECCERFWPSNSCESPDPSGNCSSDCCETSKSKSDGILEADMRLRSPRQNGVSLHILVGVATCSDMFVGNNCWITNKVARLFASMVSLYRTACPKQYASQCWCTIFASPIFYMLLLSHMGDRLVERIDHPVIHDTTIFVGSRERR